MKKMIIYTNETCGYCKTIKEVLNKNNIKFEERLTNEWQKEWNEVSILTGMATTPTICFKDSYFIPARDFQTPQHLVEIFNKFEKPKFSKPKEILEKLKTLNYNILTAFTRLDQLLRQIETNTKKE